MRAVTSIAPKNIERQQQAIASWVELGFLVTSINNQEDINNIQKHFPKVQFQVTNLHAKKINADENIPAYVSLRAILDFIFKSDRSWIINSDIILDDLAHPQISYLENASHQNLVFGNRIDVESVSSRSGNRYDNGYDYFILGPELDHIFTSRTHVFMGQPWWDYWMPLTCIRKGIKPKLNMSKIAYHVEHDTNWNIDQMFRFGNIVAKDIGAKQFKRHELELFAEMSLRTIQDFSEKI